MGTSKSRTRSSEVVIHMWGFVDSTTPLAT
jgi:hypothetical protein